MKQAVLGSTSGYASYNASPICLTIGPQVILPLLMLTRMVDCVTWNFSNQIVVGNAGTAAQSLSAPATLYPAYRLLLPNFPARGRSLHVQYSDRWYLQAHDFSRACSISMPLRSATSKWFHRSQLPELRHPDRILMSRAANLRHVKPRLRNGLSTRDSRLVHAAEGGKFTGLFIYVFNGLFMARQHHRTCATALKCAAASSMH